MSNDASSASTNIKMDTVDLEQLCRLCLNQTDDENLIGIFENDEKSSLSIRIMACSALEVSTEYTFCSFLNIVLGIRFQVQENDGLPRSMCIDCRQLLEKFYYFRKKSKNSDTKLRRHLRLINAGKPSNVFATAGGEDDDYEDDYIESRELFAKWDAQRIATEQRINDERDKEVQVHLERAVESVRAQETKRIFEEARKHLMEEMAIKAKTEQKAAKAQAALEAAEQEAGVRPTIAESVRLEVQELIVADETVEGGDCDADGEQMEVVDYLEDGADDLDDNKTYEFVEIVDEADVKNESSDSVEIDDEAISMEGEFAVDEAKSGKFYFIIIICNNSKHTSILSLTRISTLRFAR